MFQSVSILFGLGLAAIMTPGPDFALVLQSATSLPKRQAFACAAGIMVGVSAHLAYLLLGAELMTKVGGSPLVVLRSAGVIYLTYIGVRSLIAARALAHEGASTCDEEISSARAFLRGLLCNLLNAKAVLFLGSLLAQFIDTSTPPFERLVYVCTLWTQAGAYWFGMTYLLGRSSIRERVRCSRCYFEGAFGVAMILFAVLITAHEL